MVENGDNTSEHEEIGEDNSETTPDLEAEFDELLTAAVSRYEDKKAKREAHAEPDREGKKKVKLDSSIKKNSAFVKKLSGIKEAQLESLSKELDGLNFARYVEEAADAVAEGKFKLNDVGAVVTIAAKLHVRYEDYSSNLYNSFKKKYTTTKAADDPSRLKVDLKLIADLTVNGIFTDKLGLGMLHHELKSLIEFDKESNEHSHVLISICKSIGEDVFGFLPQRLRELSLHVGRPVPMLSVIESKKRAHFVSLVNDYYESAKAHVLEEHKLLKKMEKQNRSIYAQRGEIHEERRMALVEQKEKRDGLKKIIDELSGELLF